MRIGFFHKPGDEQYPGNDQPDNGRNMRQFHKLLLPHSTAACTGLLRRDRQRFRSTPHQALAISEITVSHVKQAATNMTSAERALTLCGSVSSSSAIKMNSMPFSTA